MSKLRKILGFIVSLIFFAILVYLFLIDFFPPRIFLSPYYILSVFFITGLFFFVFDFAFSRLIHKIERSKFFQSSRQWSNRKRLILYVLFIVLIISLSLIKPVIDNINDTRVLEVAKQQFLPVTCSNVSDAEIDRTLVELQKALDRLRGEYVENPPVYLIKVYLFSDVDELISETGMAEWAAGGALTLPGRPPEIAIPVEEESSIWSGTLPTTTPSHEITHVVTFEAMQLKDKNLVPRFYREGLAEFESLRVFNRFPDRIFNRIKLIFYRNQLARLKTIPTLNINDVNVNREDVALFYRLSGEFVRFLVHEYGEHTPWYVVQDVGQGANYYEAFKREYNKEYSDMFSEFLEYFY